MVSSINLHPYTAEVEGGGVGGPEEALTTLYELERTIQARCNDPVVEGAKPSWTRRLLDNPELLCKKVREVRRCRLTSG